VPAASRRLIIAAIIALLVVSAGLRMWHLQRPADYMFDEVYYAKDAKTIVDGRVGPSAKKSSWEPGDEVSWPHAEAGKFAIALGILVAGDGPLGWRLAPALAGIVILCSIYPIARRLGLPAPWALLALLLAATDPLNLVQSRIATLDVFVALWTTLCVLFALRAAQGERRALWLPLCGLAGGLALATKWSGALALVAAAAILVLGRGEAGDAAPDDGESPPAGRPLALAVLFAGLCLVVLPLSVYLLSYAQYFWSGHTWSDWLEMQRQMWHFNLTLSAPHSYASRPITWIADYRPVWYSFVDKGGMYEGVVGMGNPFLWWTAMAALVAMPIARLGRRQIVGALLTAIIVAILYLPWMAASRTSFLFYMAPVAPMLAVLVAHALRLLAEADAGPRGERRPWRPPAFVAAGFVLAAFFWYPIGRVCQAVLGDLTGRLGDPVAFTVAAMAAIFAAVALVLLLVRTRRAGVRSAVSLLWAGAIAGIFVAFLPILVAHPMAPEDFYRLIWFPSWI
jgi:dolichyl-phosphate-mannose--protein O-mannosyl transferase